MIDTSTGLPELPEGYRWLVQQEAVEGGIWKLAYIRVAVVHDVPKPKLFTGKPHPTKTVVETAAYRRVEWKEYAEHPYPEKFIKGMALDAMDDFKKYQLRTTRTDRLEGLLGTYPPKKLET